MEFFLKKKNKQIYDDISILFSGWCDMFQLKSLYNLNKFPKDFLFKANL